MNRPRQHGDAATEQTARARSARRAQANVLQAVAAVHGVSPEEIVHLGDSVEFDVRPALHLGARAVWINVWITDHPLALPAELADLAGGTGRLHVAPTLAAAVAYTCVAC
ncbi:MAG TPA: hypothetical protein VM347_43720 [Nonomuraea sp.]|nr:hypothetical protein [Nonomuraea sp.]